MRFTLSRRRSVVLGVAASLIAALLQAVHALPAQAAEAGTLDPTFGSGGVMVQSPPNPPGPQFTIGVAVPDLQGRILVGGGDPGDFGQDSVLARLTADGLPDTGFNGGATGIEFDAFGGDGEFSVDDRITGLAVHPTTGDIYIASTTGPGGNPAAGAIRVQRFGPNGAGPSAIRDFGPGMVEGQLAFSGTRLIMASTFSPASGPDFGGVYVAGMLPDTLGADVDFADDGDTVATDGTRAVFQALATDGNGNILLGAHQGALTTGAHLFKLDPSGTPDSSFGGGDGHVRVLVTGDDWITSIAPSTDGRIAVAGRAFPNSHVSLLDDKGNYDTGFNFDPDGGTGRLELPGSVWTVAWDPSGKILYGQENRGVVGRLLDNGAADTTFGVGSGRTAETCPANTPGDRQVSLIVQATRVVTAGDCALAGGPGLQMFTAGFLLQASGPPTPTSLTLTVDAATTLPGADSVPIGDIPPTAVPLDPTAGAEVGGTPLRSVDLATSPLRSVPLRSVPLRSVPLRSVPLRSVTLSELPLLTGTWEAILDSLVPNPFAGVPLQAITLDQMLEADPPALATISLGSIDLAASPLRSVTLGSVALGALPLRSVPFDGNVDTAFASFCAFLATIGYSCTDLGITADSSLLAVDLAGIPLRSVPLRSVPLRSVPLRSVDLAAINVTPESVPLRSVPLRSVNWSSALGTIPTSIIDPAKRASILTCDASSCPTLRDAATANAIVESATLGALFDAIDPAALPEGLTLADLLQALVNPADYPWESVNLDQLGLADFQTEGPELTYTLSFSVSGSGTGSGTASVDLPPGFRYVQGSTEVGGGPILLSTDTVLLASPDIEIAAAVGFNPTIAGNRLTWALDDVAAGENVTWTFRVRPGLTLGPWSSTATVAIGDATATTGPTAAVTVREPGFARAAFTDGNDDPGTAPTLTKDTLQLDYVFRSGDVDYFKYPVPPAGTRVQIFLSHLNADNDLVLYGNANSTPLRSVPLRSVPLRSVPLTDDGIDTDAMNDQVSPETLDDIPTLESIPLRSVSEARSNADEVISTTSRGEGGDYTIQVSGYNGVTRPEAYMLRVKEFTPPPPPDCAGPRTFPNTGTRGTALDLGSLPGNLNTLVVTSRKRLGDAYGTTAAGQALTALTGVTTAGGAGVVGAILDVDATAGSPADAALAAWDADPCSPQKANLAFDQIYELVHAVRDARPSLENIVIAGGDDIIPMARIADYTQISNESDYALSTTTDALTDNGTPTSAALATMNILTDDPLADVDAIEWLDHSLHIPDLGIGRLVESPADIVAQANQFVAANGVLDPTTALTTGYDFLTDGSTGVDDALEARIPDANRQQLINETWTRADVTGKLFPATGQAPGVASVNAHYDHSRALPALGNSTLDESDLYTVKDDVKKVGNDLKLTQRILFTMGCHSGLALPDAYVGDTSERAPDWAQAYLGEKQKAAVYFANTGFGYGDTAAVAYSEEVMRQFALRLDGSLTVGEAAVYAKQAFFGGLGTYTAYDEKAAQEATFYGFPMYRIGATGPTPPAIEKVTPEPVAGLDTVPVSINPTFEQRTSRGGGSFYTVNGGTFDVDGAARTVNKGEAQLAHNRPVQPRVSVPATADGKLAKGVLITELTSADTTIVPAISRPTIDLSANEPPPPAGDVAFPTSFQNLTTFNTPNGQEQRVVFLPGQFFRDGEAASAAGVQRLFSHIGAEIGYSDNENFAAPELRNIVSTKSGTTASFSLQVTDEALGGVRRVIVLVKDGSGLWRRAELTSSGGSTYTGTLPGIVGERIEYFAQAQDVDGNVAVSTNKGRYFGLVLADGAPPATPQIVTTPSVPNGSNGWFRGSVTAKLGSPVAGVTYTMKADGQPVANPLTGTTFTTDGVHTVDVEASDGGHAVAGIAIDSTPPTKPVIEGMAAGSSYATGVGRCSSTDALSGIASCTVTSTTNASGVRTVTATAADRAGNFSTTSYVTGFAGFQQPINDTAHSITPDTSIFKAGSNVPVRFQILDALGKPMQVSPAPVWLPPVNTGIAISGAVNEPSLALAPDAGSTFKWDPATQSYTFTWRSPKNGAGVYWKISVKLTDEQIYSTFIGLR
jgi:hypothetical protein